MVVLFHRFLDGVDGIAQRSVAYTAVLGDDGSVLRGDEPLVHQLTHILPHRFGGEIQRLADIPVGRPALIMLKKKLLDGRGPLCVQRRKPMFKTALAGSFL